VVSHYERVGSTTVPASEPKVSALAPYRAFLSSGLLVFAASMTMNVGGFVFHAIASRRLGVADYGGLYALISLCTIGAIPVSVFTPVVVKYAAEFRALHDDGHVRGLISLMLRSLGTLGIAYAIAGFVFAPEISRFLHVAPWEASLAGLIVAAMIVSGALRSVGVGIQAFTAYAGSLSAEGTAKVVILIIFAFGTLTIGRSIGAMLLGSVIGITLMALPLAARYRSVRELPVHLDYRRILATTGGAASLATTMAVMGFADVVIVKHFFDATQAGLYSAASLGGKVLLYFVSFVPAILIPHATHRFALGQRTRETLWAGIVFIIVVSVLGVVAYRVGGLILLHVLVGRAFDGATSLLPGYATAMAFLALTSALASYGIATHRLAFSWPLLVATLLTLGVLTFSHASLQVVIAELVGGNVVMALVVAGALGWQGRASFAR
jgi:O-antigen/teichoic acid export membrane protein